MADKLEIRLVIKPDGTVELTTHGLKGEECMTETKDLESAVGRVQKRTKTSEYHQAPSTTRTTIRRG